MFRVRKCWPLHALMAFSLLLTPANASVWAVTSPTSGTQIANNVNIDVGGTKISNVATGSAYLQKKDANGNFVRVTNSEHITGGGSQLWEVTFTVPGANWTNGAYRGEANGGGGVYGPEFQVVNPP